MKHIVLRQQMRNLVLSNEFEIKINRALLEKQRGQWQLHVDKTLFCEIFEEDLHNSELTEHQQDDVKIGGTWWHGHLHGTDDMDSSQFCIQMKKQCNDVYLFTTLT